MDAAAKRSDKLLGVIPFAVGLVVRTKEEVNRKPK